MAQSPAQEIFSQLRETVFGQDALYLLPLYFLQEFFFVLGPPGSVSCQHLEEYDPYRPDVGLVGVFVPSQRFRRHVKRRPDIILAGFQHFLSFDPETEVRDLESVAVGQQEVGRLQIPMDEALLVDLLVTEEELVHVVVDFRLGEGLLDFAAEVAFTKFRDDVGVVFGGVDFVEGEDMGHILHGFEDVDLRSEEGPVNFALEHLEIDDFDGDWFIGAVVAALVDLAGVTLADSVVEPVGEILYFLAGIGSPLHQLIL